MRKNIVLISLLLAVSVAATAFAQEEGGEGDLYTQGELAQKLVRMLGLYRYLPPAPTTAECFAILMVNKVSPKDGWEADKPVTREDLAMIIVRAMGKESSVKNPDDPASWVEALQEMGVPIEQIGQVVNEVPPAEDFKSTEFGPAPSDPSEQQRMLGQPDERQLQSNLSYTASVPLSREEVRSVLQGIDPNDVKPAPVTPN